jgi:hypothetical protein
VSGVGHAPEVVAATLRGFLDACGGERASALLDRGEEPALLVEAAAGGVAEVSEGEETRLLLAAADALPLPHVHAFPPLEVDAARAEVTAPMGAVAHLAGAVLELVARLGGRSVLTVEWATTDPGTPFAVAARSGDPVVLAVGRETFPMPEGWP